MKNLLTLLGDSIQHGASDVHIVVGTRPMVRVSGELQEFVEERVTQEWFVKQVAGVIGKKRLPHFTEHKDIDVAVATKRGRFRVNVHRQGGSYGLAARYIPDAIPEPDALRFEDALYDMVGLHQGLVLVVGATGSGKSTTIASLIHQIIMERAVHVITVEDPVEFIFDSDKALVEQREIGRDTPSFASALKHVLRQDPDVIVVGEMRDPETIATAITAAETGHLVISTLHTSTAPEAIERIVDVFDGPKQKQILTQLASTLEAVVAQRLLPSEDGDRVAAREILVSTPAVRNMIRENNIAQLRSAMQTGKGEGMIPFERSMQHLYEEGIISEETLHAWGS